MSKYSIIQNKIWHDDTFRNQSDNAKTLFLYLLTSPHINMLGYYFLPKEYMKYDLNWSIEKTENILTELKNNFSVYYDEKNQIVFIKNYLKYNPLYNTNQAKGAIKIIDEFAKTEFFLKLKESIIEFNSAKKEVLNILLKAINNYEKDLEKPANDNTTDIEQRSKPIRNPFETPDLEKKITEIVKTTHSQEVGNDIEAQDEPIRNPFETVSKSNTNTNTESNTNTISISSFQEKTEPDFNSSLLLNDSLEKPINTKNKKVSRKDYSEAFTMFWDNYPRKENKTQTEKIFNKVLKSNKITSNELIEASKNYNIFCKQNNRELQYIKLATTFLNQETFKDYILNTGELFNNDNSQSFTPNFDEFDNEAYYKQKYL